MEDEPENNKKEEGLEREVEKGNYFLHTALSRQANRINEIESFLYGLIDTMINKEMVSSDELSKMANKVREEAIDKGEYFHLGVALRVDGEDGNAYSPVNCAERIHICKAICCKLSFALTVDELETGNIKWDFGQPYYIRHKPSGFCQHLDEGNCSCTIYEERPGICKKYSCATDERIWKDFDKMELNEEWLSNNFIGQKLQLKEVFMLRDQQIEYKSRIVEKK